VARAGNVVHLQPAQRRGSDVDGWPRRGGPVAHRHLGAGHLANPLASHRRGLSGHLPARRACRPCFAAGAKVLDDDRGDRPPVATMSMARPGRATLTAITEMRNGLRIDEPSWVLLNMHMNRKILPCILADNNFHAMMTPGNEGR